MEKIKFFVNKYCFFVVLVMIVLVRMFLSCNLPSFYLDNLQYDDKLMIEKLTYLNEQKYLGEYKSTTLVKGVVYPLFLYLTNLANISYSMMLTILYVLACLYLVFALRKIVKSKLILIAISIFLLLNPISFSSDIFQRLYRNSLSIIELLFFFGTVVNIINSKKNSIINYIVLGIIAGIMFLSREDTIWIILVYLVLVIYKLYKNLKIQNIVKAVIPIIITAIMLNIICYVNYINYGVYTYNEITNSNFKKAYIKILQIKDDEKKDKVAISKSTLLKLAENSNVFNLTEKFIEKKYKRLANLDGEIYNGNIIWYLRYWLYQLNHFKTGEEANNYFEDLSNEIDELFEKGVLEKEFVIPSVHINTPTINEITELPMNILETIKYTTAYQNIKTFTERDLAQKSSVDEVVKAYKATYKDYHNAENMIDSNPFGLELLRNIYKYFTIVFSIIALIIYLRNIQIKDKLNILTHIVLLTYLVILCGVAYTNTTAFSAIRYCYLGGIYILQNLFIMLNVYRVYEKKRGNKNDISNNTSIQ